MHIMSATVLKETNTTIEYKLSSFSLLIVALQSPMHILHEKKYL